MDHVSYRLGLGGVLVLVIACGGSPANPTAEMDGDAGGACGPFPALDSLSLSEGGRVAIAREGALADPSLSFEATGAVSVADDGSRVLVYAAYGPAADAAPSTIRVRCAGGGVVETAPEIRPLAWTLVADWDPATSGPLAREYGAWWLDEERGGGLYVFGGFHYVPRQFTPAWDLWRYDFATASWTEMSSIEPPMAPGGRVAAGREPGTILYFGGSTPMADGSIDTPSVLRELSYSGDTKIWTEAPFESSAPGSYTGALIRDERRDRWLSVCGVDARLLGIHCRVHAYTPEGGWSQVFVADGPMPHGRFGFHYAYDEETDRVIVAGGQTGPGNLDMTGDAWALELGEDPPRWVELTEDLPEIRRRNGSFVLDPIGRRLFVWGGTADGMTTVQGLFALGVDRGRERWDRVDVPEEVPERTSGIGVYDPIGARALFGFGNSDDVYTDLWSLAL